MVDTMELMQPGEGVVGYESVWASFEDKNGWVWVPQEGRVTFIKNDTIRGIVAVSAFKTADYLPMKMLMTPDSILWGCSYYNLFRYSEKYAIPQEILNGTSATLATTVASPNQLSLVTHAHGLDLQPSAGSGWQVRIASVSGQVAWQKNVTSPQSVELSRGVWFVQAKNTNGQSMNRIVAISQ